MIDNETWVIETGGDVIVKASRDGRAALTDWETLVYCLWVADYGMRNTGDLQTALDLDPDFQVNAERAARRQSLVATREAFGLTLAQLEREYFARFDAICAELRSAEPASK